MILLAEYNTFISKYFTLDNLYNILWKILVIFIILTLMYLVIKAGDMIIDKSVSRKKGNLLLLSESRSKTYGNVLKSILKYGVYFLGILVILSTVFGLTGLSFAAVGGLAVAFGAQSLIKDVLNGFFILFEDQYSVGDYITIGDKSGIVEGLELRITKLRDFSGDLHIIPNGLIEKVTNHSRGLRRVMLQIDIAYEENIDNAVKIINNVCSLYSREDPDMIEEAKVFGVSSLNDNSVSIRVIGKSNPLTEVKCEMELRKKIKEELDKEGIEIPYPKIMVIKGE